MDPASQTPPVVAVLGLGIIGSRAVARLRDSRRWQVRCWNRTPKDFPGEASCPEDAAAGATFISLYLKDVPAVRETMERVLPRLEHGQTVLNHSTVDPPTTLWLAAECAKRGCAFLDVPFTGSKIAAGGGQLVYYAAGIPEILETAMPYLRETSREVVSCGGEPGAATVVKLATNLVSACTVQALAEGLAVATRHGVSSATFMAAIAGNVCGSPLAAFKLSTIAANDFETHFSLDNMRKDSRYAIELAESANLETPAIRAVSQRMTQLCADGLANLDYSALAKPYL